MKGCLGFEAAWFDQGAVVTLQALGAGLLPGTLDFEDPDPQIDFNISATTTRCAGAEAAITNASGFGGHTTTLVITPCQTDRRWLV